jgi:hypothetical protein
VTLALPATFGTTPAPMEEALASLATAPMTNRPTLASLALIPTTNPQETHPTNPSTIPATL